MATRIRLQRRGKKNQPFYHLVIADGRVPRDGRFIEDLGTYNPLTNPATLNINFDRALYWLETGATPTDTARAILKREGVYLMKHLRGGIAKGALSEAQAQQKFEAWKKEKDSKLNSVAIEERDKKRAIVKERLAAETKVKEAMAAKIAAHNAELAAAAAKAAQEAAEAAAAEAAANAEETAPAEETPATEEAAPAEA